MTRTSAFLVPALLLAGCASAAPRPATSMTTAGPPDTVVRVAGQGIQFRMPHEWWLKDDDGDASVTTLIHERRGVTVTVATRPLDGAGFVATADAVRREALAAGCEMRRGSATYVTDQFGRRAVMSARRMSGGDIQNGEITVLELEGRNGVIVISGWWPESPSDWMLDEVHAIVDSIRVLPGN